MSPVVYEFESYKEYLHAWLEAQPKAGHGFRRRMAEAIGTQTGFITQVLGGTAHFSPEQALALADLLGHSNEELQFFLLLLQKERAGTPAYRRHVEGQMNKMREERQTLAKRLKVKSFPSEVDQSLYFSSWIYACVHVMVTCVRFQNSRQEIAEALRLPVAQISAVLEFLIRTGLVRETANGFEVGEARVHLGTESPYLRRHHANWNLLALQKILSEALDRDLQYSSVISLSSEDVPRVREIFTRAIEEAKAIVRESNGEKIYASTVNLFEIC